MNAKTVVVASMIALSLGVARAGTIIRYHFSEGESVVNAASPGTFDGEVRSIEKGYDTGKITYGKTASRMPVYTDSFREDSPHVYEQNLGTVVESGGALNWNGTAVRGGVVVPYAEGLLLSNFTVEAFVRLPPEAAARSGNEMFPIAQLGRDQRAGWIFSVFQGRLFVRLVYKDSANGDQKKEIVWGTSPLVDQWGVPKLFDGKWHHVAFSFSSALSAHTCCARLYLDGTLCGATRGPGWNGWWWEQPTDLTGDNQEYPLVIGVNPFHVAANVPRAFMGEIAEFRMSDEVLKEETYPFLNPVPAGPVDDDTAVMLRFGENAAMFGPDAQTNVLVTADGATSEWFARTWNLQNAAYRNPMQPRWYVPTLHLDRLRPLQLDSAPGSVIRKDGTSPEHPDGKSLTFEPTAGGTNDIIQIPGAYKLAENDFTIEFFLKTTNHSGSDTGTIIWSNSSAGTIEKWCVFQGRLLFRGIDMSSGTGKSFDLVYNSKNAPNYPIVNDGKWHHAAVVYHRDTHVIDHFIDYKMVERRKNTDLRVPTQNDFFFVGAYQKHGSQTFKGAIDSLRITRRALHRGEFLVSSEAVSDRVLDVTFDREGETTGALKSGQDPALSPDGTTGLFANGEQPVLVRSQGDGYVLDGEKGPRIREPGQALYLKNAYALWTETRLLERNACTVEFFAKFGDLSQLDEDFLIVRHSQGQLASYSPVWSLMYRGENKSGHPRLIFYACTHTNNANFAAQSAVFKAAESNDPTWLGDGKWHHWAMTVRQDPSEGEYDGRTVLGTVTAKLYRDYEPYGEVTVPGKIFYPNSGAGSCFSLGGAGPSTQRHFEYTVDDVRISPDVLPVEKFLRFQGRKGLTLLVK